MRNKILEKSIILFALTLGVASYVIWTGGLAGHLKTSVKIAAAVMALGTVLSVSLAVRFFFGLEAKDRGLFVLICCLAGFYSVPIFSPIIEGDSLAYHLYLPKIFLSSDRIYFVPYNGNSLFPLLFDNLFCIGEYFKSLAVSKAIAFLTAVFLSLMAGLFASELFREKRALLPAILIVLSMPAVVFNSTTCYNDIATAFFAVAGLYLVLKWVTFKGKYDFYLSAAILGLGIGTKYTAMYVPVIVSGVLAYESFVSRRGITGFIRQYVLFFGIIFLFGGWWYLRAFVITGNPFYPYLYKIFGPVGWFSDAGADLGFGKGLISYLCGFWNVSMFPEKFGGGPIGIVLLCFAPLVFLVWGRLSRQQKKLMQIAAFFCVAYFTMWFFVSETLRLLYPLVIVLCSVVAVAVSMLGDFRGFAYRTLKILFWTCVAINVTISSYYTVEKGRFLLSPDRETYVADKSKTYGTAVWINKNIPDGSKIMVCDEPSVYYFDVPLIRETPFRYLTQYDKMPFSEDTIRKLLEGEGITHLVLRVKKTTRLEMSATEYPEGTIPYYLMNGKISFVKLIHSEEVTDKGSGEKFGYYVYEIMGRGPLR